MGNNIKGTPTQGGPGPGGGPGVGNPFDPNFIGPPMPHGPGDLGIGIDVTAPPYPHPPPPPGGGGWGGDIPNMPNPPMPGLGPQYPPNAGPGKATPEGAQPNQPTGPPAPPGDGGIGGGGGGTSTYSYNDPSLPFIPNYGAGAPGGNYQPTPYEPKFTPWAPDDYRGGRTPQGKPPAPFSPPQGPPGSGGIPPPPPPGGPGGGPESGSGPGRPTYGEFNPNDPYNTYYASLPIMQREQENAINSAAAQIAPGNRYSTAMNREAMQIGADTGLRSNAMLMKTLYDHSQQDLNRGLQATGMGLQTASGDADRRQRGEQIGGMFAGQDLDRMLQAGQAGINAGMAEESISRDRLRDLYGAGQYETDRTTKLGLLPYEEFLNSRKGYLPEMLGAAQAGAGAGVPQSPIQSNTAGKPGLIDIGMATAPIWGPFAGMPWLGAL